MSKISRREFVEGTGAGLVIATAVPLSGQDDSHAGTPAAPHTTIKILVNGSEQRTQVEDRWTLSRSNSTWCRADPLAAVIG